MDREQPFRRIFHDAYIVSVYYPNTDKYFPHILHRRLNTFRIFSEYAERKLKGQLIEWVDHKLSCNEQNTNSFFGKFNFKSALCVYVDSAKQQPNPENN